jgi:hypothetical protein
LDIGGGSSPASDPTLVLDLNLMASSMPAGVTFSRASSATDIINGVLTTFASGAPRISTANGYLSEVSRTNNARYTDLLDNSPWTGNFTGASRSGVTTINPYGVSGTVSKLVEDTSTGSHQWRPPFTGTLSSTAYTMSIFAKAAERTKVLLSCFNSGTPNLNASASFDLSNGTITSGTGKITPCANGWYRLSISGTTGTGASGTLEFKQNLYNAAGASSYTGDGTSGLYLWGAQIEVGSFLTSYIPATSAAVTRAADVCTKTTASIAGFSSSAFTLFAEAKIGFVSSSQVLASIDNTSGDIADLYLISTTLITRRVWDNYAGTNTDASVGGTGVIVKSAVAWISGDTAMCTNAGTVGTGATPVGPLTLPTLGIGCSASGAAQLNSYLRSVKVYNTRKTNAGLQAMTT